MVEIKTSLGVITVELDRKNAQLTVDNFLGYVDRGHYDRTIFHQVVKNRVILAGGYGPDLAEKKAGATIRNEADVELQNKRGTIAMARQPDAIDSATCQFFINLADNSYLDQQSRDATKPEEYGYAVFGKVTGGMEWADMIGNVEVTTKNSLELVPKEDVLIESIRRIP